MQIYTFLGDLNAQFISKGQIPNNQQIDQLQKYMDKLNDILGTVLHTDPMPTGAAHGGRIDSPLTGGSRYI